MTSRIAALLLAGLFVVGCSRSSAQPQRVPTTQRQPQGPATVVATLDGQSITLAEVDAQALQQPASNFGGARLSQALYVARRTVLDEMVGDRLIAAAAKTQGVTIDALLAREVQAPVPTPAEVEAWYKANPARVQGAPLDAVRTAIRDFLTNERRTAAREAFVDRLKQSTPVTISLDPPRVEVADGGRPARGSASAPITLIEFSDFQCPFCLRAHPTVEQVLAHYGDKIRFVYRHYPLPNHPQARPAAEAAVCAQDQGKFWEYHDRLFANPTKLSAADLKAHAATLGLDTARFNGCVDTRAHQADVAADVNAGNALGVSGTPAFFINGRMLDGAQPYDAFAAIIDDELTRLRP